MEQFLKLIEQAAQTVGMEAVRVWPDVVAITYVKALTGLLTAIVFVAVFAALAAFAFVHSDKAQDERIAYYNAFGREKTKEGPYGYRNEDKCGEDMWIVVGFICAIIAIAVFLGLCINMPDSIAALTHPEAKTVLDIIKVK